MDTLTAFLAGVTLDDFNRRRIATSREVWRESFGHPNHRVMLLAHETRVNEFYGRGRVGDEPATPEQLAELVSAVTSYRPPKKYTPRKPARISDDRLLQIAVQTAERKKAS